MLLTSKLEATVKCFKSYNQPVGCRVHMLAYPGMWLEQKNYQNKPVKMTGFQTKTWTKYFQNEMAIFWKMGGLLAHGRATLDSRCKNKQLRIYSSWVPRLVVTCRSSKFPLESNVLQSSNEEWGSQTEGAVCCNGNFCALLGVWTTGTEILTEVHIALCSGTINIYTNTMVHTAHCPRYIWYIQCFWDWLYSSLQMMVVIMEIFYFKISDQQQGTLQATSILKCQGSTPTITSNL